MDTLSRSRTAVGIERLSSAKSGRSRLRRGFPVSSHCASAEVGEAHIARRPESRASAGILPSGELGLRSELRSLRYCVAMNPCSTPAVSSVLPETTPLFVMPSA